MPFISIPLHIETTVHSGECNTIRGQDTAYEHHISFADLSGRFNFDLDYTSCNRSHSRDFFEFWARLADTVNLIEDFEFENLGINHEDFFPRAEAYVYWDTKSMNVDDITTANATNWSSIVAEMKRRVKEGLTAKMCIYVTRTYTPMQYEYPYRCQHCGTQVMQLGDSYPRPAHDCSAASPAN